MHDEKHHYYLLHQHQREISTTATISNNEFQDHQHSTTKIQPSQDLHRSITDFTTNTFQDHHLPDTTHIQPFQDQQTTDTTRSHYFQDHHANTRISSRDHIDTHKDTVHSKYTTYIFPYHTHHNIVLDEDRRHQVIKVTKTFLL